MRRTLGVVLLLVVAMAASGLTVAAQEASPAAESDQLASLGYPELRLATDGTTNDLPTEMEAGRYHVVLENQSEQMEMDLEVWQLAEGVTLDEVMAFFEEAQASGDFGVPEYFYDMVFNGGASAGSGETAGVVLDLAPGEWIFNLYTYNPETDESTDTPVTVNVTGELAAMDAPAADVTVELVDMDFAVSGPVSAGPQIWNVTDAGTQPHHLILSRVPEGTTEEHVMELAGSFGPPPASPEAGASPVAEPVLSFEDIEDVAETLILSTGNFNLIELDLEPGTYAMLCFLPAPDGTPHVLMGMVEIITVE